MKGDDLGYFADARQSSATLQLMLPQLVYSAASFGAESATKMRRPSAMLQERSKTTFSDVSPPNDEVSAHSTPLDVMSKSSWLTRKPKVGPPTTEEGGPTPVDATGQDFVQNGSRYYLLPELRKMPERMLNPELLAGLVSREPQRRPNLSADPTVRQLTEDLQNCTDRMERRVSILRQQWDHPLMSTGAIKPADPSVFHATTEEEVSEKAAAAEQFSENQSRIREHALRMAHANVVAADAKGSESLVTPIPPRHMEMSASLSTMSCSSAHVTDGAKAVLEMLAYRPDVILPSPSETSVVRTGDVLSSKHVLVVDLQEALRNRRGPTGIISGAPFFRIVPKFNIAGVAQASLEAIKTVVNELRRAHVEGPIIWVNLREEPLVYINNVAHVVRERADTLRPNIIPSVTGRGIESIEYKLKQEVLQEAQANGGNISVLVEGLGNIMENQWESADATSVYTMLEIFRALASQLPRNQLQYYRRPITQNVGPQPEDFDFVLEACLEEPKSVFVFNCQSGRGRTSAMMQIANIVRFYQFCVKDVSVDVRVLRGKCNAPTFRTIQKLVSFFPDGKLHEQRLDILMDLADRVYSMSDHIMEAFSGMDDHPEEAKMRLQQYAYFLVFSYYCEQRLWNYATKLRFADWLDTNLNLRLLITGVRDKLDDALWAERIKAPAANTDTDADVLNIIRYRRGNVLSSGRILCSLPIVEGCSVMALRQLGPSVPIFSCGRVSREARQFLVRQVREAFPSSRRLYWLSLRAEPMIIVNDISYTVTDYNAPLSLAENGTTMHVSVQAIEQIEDRLRRDVLLEAQAYGGHIVLHHLNENGVRKHETVKVRSVRTSRSLMDEFIEAEDITYHRVPIPFSGSILASDLDPLLAILSESNDDPNNIFIINDAEGSTRTSVALNVLTLYRASQVCNLRTLQTPAALQEVLRVGDAKELLNIASPTTGEEVGAVPTAPVEILLASTLCQMLTAGSLLRTVDSAITLGGSGTNYNIIHKLNYLKQRIGVTGTNKLRAISAALNELRCYLLVLLTSLYLDELGDYSKDLPFVVWVKQRSEVSNIMDTLAERGEAALRYVNSDNLMKADVSRRAGDVLTANFCLKADHFPGCQKKGLRPELCGAPNFRKVSYVNVYGVAIPTILGIHNILSLLGASSEPMQVYPGQTNDRQLHLAFAAPRLFDPSFNAAILQRPLRGSVVWVNLREEPILYVGDRPFVFRDLAAPYVNVELTGIQTHKVEHVESTLKNDVLQEAQQYNGQFLVHDEASPGELVGEWEAANESTVKTLREVYAELNAKGFRVIMLRLPVTDEQSPEISDFDLLTSALLPNIAEHLDRRETLSFVFNCQMGRGRTTTGMVVCCLLIGLVIPEYYEELRSTYPNICGRNDESDLWNGDYSIITQLKRVLADGRAAKCRVDLVLEACSKMQNLRTAIESYAVAERSVDNSEEARARAHHAGVHYLIRYFNLIVFAVYLEDSFDQMLRRMRLPFADWMAKRPELKSLVSTAALQ